MNMSEDKLQLLRFEYRLLSPMCPTKVWPKKVKVVLGTCKLVHREKAEKVLVKTLPKIFPNAQGIWQENEWLRTWRESSAILALKHSAR